MRLLRAIAATALAAGAVVMVVPAPAVAATCAGGDGVSVVVDYRELGGSTITACAADGGGKSAAAIFAEVSVQISYATRQPGFVCRVNGVPASDPCVNTSPTDAFWGLWWSDGAKPWTYSSSGVGSLTVPAGGSVGWSWQQDRAAGQTVPPGVAAPTAPAPSQTPTESPSATPTASNSPSPSRSPQPSASPSKDHDAAGSGSGPESDAGSSSPKPEKATEREPGSSPSTATPSASPESAASSPATQKRKRHKDDEEPATPVETSADTPTPNAGATTATPAEAAADPADEPTRIPAGLTWGVVALLGVAALVSAVVSRRRRNA